MKKNKVTLMALLGFGLIFTACTTPETETPQTTDTTGQEVICEEPVTEPETETEKVTEQTTNTEETDLKPVYNKDDVYKDTEELKNVCKVSEYNSNNELESIYIYDLNLKYIYKYFYPNNTSNSTMYGTYIYDENNNVVKVITFTKEQYENYKEMECYQKWGRFPYEHTYEYENNKLVREFIFSSSGVCNKYEYENTDTTRSGTQYYGTYNVSDNSIDYDDTSAYALSTFYYDKNGYLVRIGTSIYYEYDSDGNLIKETCYNSDGSESWRREYTWNDKGFMLSSVSIYSSGELYMDLYKPTYNEQGRLIKSEHYSNDKTKEYHSIYEYF